MGLLTMVVVAVMAAPAEAGAAGARGTKRTVSIKVFNDTSDSDIYVVGIGEKQAQNLPQPVTLSLANKNGGVFIAPGKSKTILVPGGKGALVAFCADEFVKGQPLPEPGGEALYNLSPGSKTTAGVYEAHDNGASTAVNGCQLNVTIPRMNLK
jgi:hypothetical protein